MAYLIAEAEAWQAAAEELMENLEHAAVPDLEDLVAAADALPLHFELQAQLQAKVDACLALGDEICAAIPLRANRSMGESQTVETLRALRDRARELRLQFQEVELLDAVIERTERWLGEATAAVSATPDLKKLQSLLEEANSIPVDLSETCEVIRGKVEQAHQWVEKVRKALPRKNKTRSNASDAGKVDYTAARSLLNEGAGIRVDVKELEDMAGVLETAETWLERVREALNESTDEAGLQSLQALLHEADDIPVEMDEHKILAAEIEARRWGLRVQPRLDGDKVTVKMLEGLVSEATGLRARLPIAAKDLKSVGLPQEVEARARLAKAQAWLKGYRTCFSPNGLGFRKGISVRKVMRLLQRAEGVPVDLSEFTRPLQESVAKAEKWLDASADILQACGIRRRTSFTLPERVASKTKVTVGAESESTMDVDGAEGGQEKEEEEEDDDDEEEEEDDEEGVQPPFTGPKIDQETLVTCVGEAVDVGVELYEAEQLKTLMQRMQTWLDQLGVVCPKRLSKRRGMRLKVTVEEVHELVKEGKAFPVDLSEEVEEIEERLDATLKWQAEVQAELLDIAREGLRESKAYKLKEVKKEGEEEEAAKAQEGAEEDEEDDVFNETHEKRVKRLNALVDQISDVGIESLEDDMIQRHLKAHKWASNAIDLLEFVDPKATITEICMAEIADVVRDGELVLYEEKVDEEAEAAGMPDTLLSSASLAEASVEQEAGSSTSSPAGVAIAAAAAAAAPGQEDPGTGKGEEGSTSPMDVAATGGRGSGGKKEFEVYITEQGEVKKRRLKVKKKKVLIESHGECDDVIQEMTMFWWDQIGRLRHIWETSRDWAKRATRLLSPGGEKVRLEVMEALLEETMGWDFEMDLLNRVRAEVERGKSILARAMAALDVEQGEKLELQALKSLITEGDKCKVLVEEIKALRKHMSNGQRWTARFQKARPEELDEMMALAEEAKEICMDLGEDLRVVLHRITRCCFCRQPEEGSLIACTECGEKYHQRCLAMTEAEAATWERTWCCPRCLVRWHMRDALAKTMVIVSKWISTPEAAPLGPLVSTMPPGMPHGLYGMEDPYLRNLEITTGKVKAWMKRLLHAVMICADRNADEVRTLGTAKLVKSSVLVEVIRLAKGDLDVDKCADVKEVIWNLSVVFWGARLVCQLRRRPSLVPLQALTAEMQSVGIHNEPLQVMLHGLIRRSHDWINKTKPLLRDGWASPTEAPVDVERLRELLKEKRNIPVRLNLERRVEAMLSEEEPGHRYCHCRGFYDGFFMVQCVACNEWFHGKCVQIRAEDLDKKTEYQCVACSEAKKVPYPYPKYCLPDRDLTLAEVDEEEEEAAVDVGGAAGALGAVAGGGGGGGGGAAVAGVLEQDEETLMADKVSLEGIFPCKKKLASLNDASNHVDVLLLPLPASAKRKKAAPDGGFGAGAMEGTTKKRPKAASAMGGGGAGGGNKPKGGGGGAGGKSKTSPKKKTLSAAAAGLRDGAGLSAAAAAALGGMIEGMEPPGLPVAPPSSSSLGGHVDSSTVSVSSHDSGETGGSKRGGRVRKPKVKRDMEG